MGERKGKPLPLITKVDNPAAKIFNNPSKIPFLPTAMNIVENMLEIADVKPGEVVYDLGCGDGRIPIMAVKKFDAIGVGVELRRDLVEKARAIASTMGIDDRLKIVHENLFNIDLSKADVVTLYLTKEALEKLRSKLERELRPGARVVAHDFRIPGWRPVAVEKLGTHRIYLYIPRLSKTLK